MTRISSFTYRNWLIAIHDAGVTALAVVVSFYLRFQGEHFTERLPLLLTILPYFVVFSFFVCYVFNLTTTKWRFISVPDLLNILRAASVLTVALLVLDYIFLGAERVRHVLSRQDHHRHLLVRRGLLSQRLAAGLSLFPLHAHPQPGADRAMRRRPC